jgi:hypothetical protein
MKHLTFDEYLRSKSVLLDHLKEDPIIVYRYMLNNYCKISIGKSVNIRDMYILKPNDIISVKWNYRDIKSPVCIKIIIDDKENDIYWKNDKIVKWLEKNTNKL